MFIFRTKNCQCRGQRNLDFLPLLLKKGHKEAKRCHAKKKLFFLVSPLSSAHLISPCGMGGHGLGEHPRPRILRLGVNDPTLWRRRFTVNTEHGGSFQKRLEMMSLPLLCALFLHATLAGPSALSSHAGTIQKRLRSVHSTWKQCTRLRGGTGMIDDADDHHPEFSGRVLDSRTGQVLHEMAAQASPSPLDAAPEDILARLHTQQEQQSFFTDADAARDGAGRCARASSHLDLAAACAVCTGLTTESTQCPRCRAGKPAVHKLCEDEWLMRNRICIFCRLPVRRAVSKASSSNVRGAAGGAP